MAQSRERADTMTPREKFVSLIRNDILRRELAERGFGIYGIMLQQKRTYIPPLSNKLKDCL